MIRTRHILVTAGKIIPKKNFDLFVRVVHSLRKRGVEVTGVIIGDGPFREKIGKLIRSFDLDSYCLMTGFVPKYEDVLRYMSGASVYVYLEKNVPFGLTPLEAGSLGVPVVAFEGGGVEETIVDGENGRELPSNYDAGQIANLIEEMLSAPPGELNRMGQRGSEMASRWTWEKRYAHFSEIIADALG